jgi:FkbM family methyltransferase
MRVLSRLKQDDKPNLANQKQIHDAQEAALTSIYEKLESLDRLQKLDEIERHVQNQSPRQRRIIPLSNDELLVETHWGFNMVVPSWNLDVGTGIVRDGIIEPWTNQVFMSLLSPGKRVVNVGSNFGYYSILGATRVGREGKVYAIEANPHVFCILIKGIFWAGFPDVIQAYNCAAATPEMHGKELSFYFDPQFIGGGNLFHRSSHFSSIQETFWSGKNINICLEPDRRFVTRGLYCEVKTEGRTIDSIVDAPIDVMLIDAEGSESFVIAGARKTIESSAALSLIMEWDPLSYQCQNRKPFIDAMWDFLLDQQGFQVSRVCPENYRGIETYPNLQPLTREQIFTVPHSDLLLTRKQK